MNNLSVYYIVAAWFLFISVSNKEERLLATILFSASFINILIVDVFLFLDGFNYESKKEFLIKFDGSLALIMTMIIAISKTAWKHAIILTLMVLCHTMILLHLITDSYFMWAISKPFYAIYNESIIILASLQMWVSRDGMAKGLDNAFRSLQGMLFRFVFHSYRIYKSSSTQKKGKANS